MNTQFGLPLVAPSKQTLLPIIEMPSGNLHGYFTIASTTFAGTETTFALAEGSVAIQSVTPPYKGDDGSGHGVKQYMAAVYTTDEAKFQPFGGYSAWININSTGYFSAWRNPAYARQQIVDRGVLITSLLVNMAALPSASPSSPTPPDVSDGTLRWVTSMNVDSAQLDCAFFDFNWMTLFQAAMVAQQPSNNIMPLRIEIVSNPVGGKFKATLVNGLGGQSYISNGAAIFSTIRIIKLQNAVAGDYVFTFKVIDTNNLSTTCTLTLTIV